MHEVPRWVPQPAPFAHLPAGGAHAPCCWPLVDATGATSCWEAGAATAATAEQRVLLMRGPCSTKHAQSHAGLVPRPPPPPPRGSGLPSAGVGENSRRALGDPPTQTQLGYPVLQHAEQPSNCHRHGGHCTPLTWLDNPAAAPALPCARHDVPAPSPGPHDDDDGQLSGTEGSRQVASGLAPGADDALQPERSCCMAASAADAR